MVKQPSDYRWSSYAHNALGKSEELISAHQEYLKLGNSDKQRANAYRALFKQNLCSQTVQLITETALKGWVLGDSKFAHKIEKLSGRRAFQLPQGPSPEYLTGRLP